jgi:putative endonuclease
MISNKKSTSKIGSLGEDAAIAFLRRDRYKILERNYRSRLGEIDIIARDREVLVFVEVKARRAPSRWNPVVLVNERKQKKIALVAAAYLREKKLGEPNCRFDVVLVFLEETDEVERVELIKAAFCLEERL